MQNNFKDSFPTFFFLKLMAGTNRKPGIYSNCEDSSHPKEATLGFKGLLDNQKFQVKNLAQLFFCLCFSIFPSIFVFLLFDCMPFYLTGAITYI